jgi:hypothetical protein
MSLHVFYPSPELPDQVVSYAQGLVDHHKDYGDVQGNAPADLKDAVAQAKKLQPMAEEIQKLQLEVASKLDAYHRAAAPLWAAFAERLGYARVFAQRAGNNALLNFLRNYQHHTRGHQAAQAQPPAPPHA